MAERQTHLFSYLSPEEIARLGYKTPEEFDAAIISLRDLQGEDELMKLESRFLKKQTVDTLLQEATKPLPKFPTAPPTQPRPVTPTPRFPDTSKPDLMEATIEAARKAQERALAEGSTLTPSERQRVTEGISSILQTPRTPEATPAWSPLEKIAGPVLRAVGMEATAEALKPQPLMTPEQLQEYEQAITDRKAAGKQAFTAYFNQNAKDLEAIGFTKDSFVKTAASKTNDFRSYEEPDPSLFSVKTVSDFIVREATDGTGWTPEYKAQYDEYMANPKDVFNPDVGVVGALYHRSGGGIYETPLLATLRGLVLPESAVGGVTSIVSNYDKSFDERVAERLREGKGLEAVGQDLVRLAGAEPGGTVDDIAWWLGLGSSFILPLDLGAAGAVSAGLKQTTKGISKLADLAGVSKLPSEVATIKKLLVTGDLPDGVLAKLKQGSAEAADIRTLAVQNAELIPEIGDLGKKIAAIDLAKLPATGTVEEFANSLKRMMGNGYEAFVQQGKRLGLDEFTPAIERGIWGKRPVSKLPVGDSRLDWAAFREAMGKKAVELYGPGADKSINLLGRTISQEIVKLRLDRATAQGALPAPEMVLVTPTVAIAASETPAFFGKLRQQPIMQRLHDLADQDKIIMSGADIKTLYAVTNAERSNLFNGTKIYVPTGKLSRLADKKTLELTRGEFNEIIDRTVFSFAKNEPTALTIQQLSTISRAAARQIELPNPAFNKLNAALTRIRIANVFKPQFTRPTGFVKIWQENISPIIQVLSPKFIRPTILSPEELFAKSTLVSKLSGVPENYKVAYDQAIAKGMNHEEAFAEAITSPFANDAGGFADLFANFYAAIYGGYDTIVDIASLRTGMKAGEMVPKQNLIKLFYGAYEEVTKAPYVYQKGDPIILQLADIYAKQGTTVDKVKALTLGAQLLANRQLGDFITNVTFINANAVRKLADKTPVFPADSLHVPLFAAHIQQAQTNIVEEVIYGTLFTSQTALNKPNIRTLLQASGKDVDTIVKNLTNDYFTFPGKMPEVNQELATYVDRSFRNAISTSNNPMYKADVRHVRDFVKSILKKYDDEGADVIFSRASISTVSEIKNQFARDLFRQLGYEWDVSADLLINKPDKVLNDFMTKNVFTGLKLSVPSTGEKVLSSLLGSVSPALTADEVRAWLGSLKNLVAGAKRTTNPALQVADTSGLYNISAFQSTLKNSIALRQVEEAFTAYDYLRDTRNLGALSENIRTEIGDALASSTSDFAESIRKAIEAIPVKETPRDKMNMIAQQTGAAVVEGATVTLPSFIKQSLLGGGYVPNLVYHFQNFMSGPMILALTLKRTEGMHKYPILGFLSDYNIFKFKDFETPSGRTYTYTEVMDIAQKNGLISSASQMAEINKNILADMIRYSGRTKGDLFGGMQKGKAWYSTLAKGVGFQGFSVWSQFANNMDMAYRRKALVQALKAGETEEQAIETARKALFDYNDITDFEREYIAKYAWFYRFMRQNLVQTTVEFLDNPARIARQAKLAKINFSKLLQGAIGEDGEVHEDIAAYKDNRAFIKLIEGLDKERLALYTPSMPILEATTLMFNAIALFGVLASEAGLIEMDPLSKGKVIDKAIESFNANPAILMAQLGLARTFGVGGPTEGLEQRVYLDPRLVALAKVTRFWNTLNAFIDVKMEAEDPRVGITTFDGYYYKIDPGSKDAWNLIMEIVKVIGLSRATRDYATILQFVGPEGMKPGVDITTGNWLLDALRFAGMVNVTAEPTIPEAEKRVRKEVTSALTGQEK